MFFNSYFSEREIRMNKPIFAIAGLLALLGLPTNVFAAELGSQSYEAEGIEHGISESGLTGLTHVISPYTMGYGLAATVNGGIQPQAGVGNAIILYPAVTLGLGSRIELSARTALVNTPTVSSAIGDTEFSAKYRFRSLGETMPAMAVVATVILPTANNAASTDVNTASGRIFVVAGGDVQVSDNTVIGIYANVGANFIDPGEATQNNYMSYGLGIMAPISDDNRLHGYIEFNTNPGKTTNTAIGRDWNGHLTLGARYTTKLLKISAGVENGWAGTVLVAGVTVGF